MRNCNLPALPPHWLWGMLGRGHFTGRQVLGDDRSNSVPSSMRTASRCCWGNGPKEGLGPQGAKPSSARDWPNPPHSCKFSKSLISCSKSRTHGRTRQQWALPAPLAPGKPHHAVKPPASFTSNTTHTHRTKPRSVPLVGSGCQDPSCSEQSSLGVSAAAPKEAREVKRTRSNRPRTAAEQH